MAVGQDSEARFEFGENWRRFLTVLDEDRISEAERSLRAMLGELHGLSFLDIGCGSGLSSLAAHRLGAARVHSFDFDADSVRCTQELRSRYAPNARWTVEQASVLDAEYLRALGEWDVVYSWGVLHHTGDMWTALEAVIQTVAADGRLFIAIYNDRGVRTDRWRKIKHLYNQLPTSLRAPYVALVMAPTELKLALRPRRYVRIWRDHRRKRGMSRWHDMVDWVGGYPFETAKADQIFNFYATRGFTLVRLATRPGQNEFVFKRSR